MKEEPPVPDALREEDVPERLVDEIGKGGADDTGDCPPVVMKEICKQEADDDAGEYVEDEEHVLKVMDVSLFG